MVNESFIRAGDSFRNELNDSLYERVFESSVHTIHQKLNTAVLLRDTQQFWYGFKGSYVLWKIEQKHNIMFKFCDFSDLHRCNNKNLRYSCRHFFFNETCVKSLFQYKTDTNMLEISYLFYNLDLIK